MNSKNLVILTIFSTLFLMACGKKENETTYVEQIRLPEETSVNDLSKKIVLDYRTPESVGTLVAYSNLYDTNRIKMCTAFLISKDQVMTNSHCIPDYIKNKQIESCKDNIVFAIKGKNETVSAKCEKIIYFSDIKNSPKTENDYALIKINRSINSDKFYELERSGVVENKKVKILTMNHHVENGNIISDYIEHNCLIKSSDVFNNITNSASSPVTSFKEKNSKDNCKIIGGNSGSPVLNEKNKLIGIVHAGISQDETFNTSTQNLTNVSKDIAIFTNLKCLTFKNELDKSMPSDCQTEVNENMNALKADSKNEKIQATLAEKLQKVLNDKTSELPNIGQFNQTIQKNILGKIILSYSPKCLNKTDSWPQVFKANISSSTFGKKTAILALNQYEVISNASLDYYGSLVYSIDTKLYTAAYFTIKNLQKIDSNGNADISAALEDGKTLESKISACL